MANFSKIPVVRKGQPITADDYNALRQAIIERTPQTGLGTSLSTGAFGFSYSATTSLNSKFNFGFKVINAGADTFKIVPSVIVGLDSSWIVPEINNQSLLDDPQPTITANENDYIYIKIEIEPEVIGDDESGYSLGEGIEKLKPVIIKAANDDDEAQPASVDENGEVENLIHLIPLARIGKGGKITQLMFGPLSVEYCAGVLIIKPTVVVTPN